MRILVTGGAGQLGWELRRALAIFGEVVAPPREILDLASADSIVAAVRRVRPSLIVNAAAYTAVDKAESESELAMKINGDAPRILAEEAARRNAALIHYSTDYVFDGRKAEPYREDDEAEPINVYGRTKLAGEQGVMAAKAAYLIFRTSWVYGSRGRNFFLSMLRLGRERRELKVVDDQFGAPTGAELLADVSAHALRTAVERPRVAGVYHVVARGETSWHGYAQHVIEFARSAGRPIRVTGDAIVPVPTSAFPTTARRPANSRLNTKKFRDTFGLSLPAWQLGVERMLVEMLD